MRRGIPCNLTWRNRIQMRSTVSPVDEHFNFSLKLRPKMNRRLSPAIFFFFFSFKFRRQSQLNHSPKTTVTTKGNAECGLEERRVKMLWLTTSRQIAADLSLPTVQLRRLFFFCDSTRDTRTDTTVEKKKKVNNQTASDWVDCVTCAHVPIIIHYRILLLLEEDEEKRKKLLLILHLCVEAHHVLVQKSSSAKRKLLRRWRAYGHSN